MVNWWIIACLFVTMDMLKPPGHMDFSASNLDEAWRRWEQQFKTYFLACEIGKKDPDVQVAILLHAAGAEAQEIHSQFKFETGEDPKSWELVLKKFSSYCKPRKNTVFERYRFWCRDQSQGSRLTCGLKTWELVLTHVSLGMTQTIWFMIKLCLVLLTHGSRRGCCVNLIWL